MFVPLRPFQSSVMFLAGLKLQSAGERLKTKVDLRIYVHLLGVEMWLNSQTVFPSDVSPLFLNTHSQPQFKGARAQCYKTFYSCNIPVFVKR